MARSRFVVAALAFAVVVALPPPGSGDERVPPLVKQLGAPDFHDRERAAEKLKEIGEPALPAVVEATGAGLCVPMAVDEFAQAIVQARERHAELQERAGAARDWLLAHRGYDVLATRVDRALRDALRVGRSD